MRPLLVAKAAHKSAADGLPQARKYAEVLRVKFQ